MSTAHVGQVAAPLVGMVLGRYRLERLLGEGGMGVVYAARHEDLGRLVAVKSLNERYDASEQTRARFRREGQTASRIGHPNIVDVYDAATSREGPLSVERSARRSKVLRSQPPGANVWIAGKLVGQTPLPVAVQGDSPVEVELHLSGFETQLRALTPSDLDEIGIELAAAPLGPKRAKPRPAPRPELAPR